MYEPRISIPLFWGECFIEFGISGYLLNSLYERFEGYIRTKEVEMMRNGKMEEWARRGGGEGF